MGEENRGGQSNKSVGKVLAFRGKYWPLSNLYRSPSGFQVEEKYKALKHSMIRDGVDWKKVRVPIMHSLEVQKYQEPELAQFLLETGEMELVEGNWWHDQFWGSCGCALHRLVPGENQLGKILMEVREELKKGNEGSDGL